MIPVTLIIVDTFHAPATLRVAGLTGWAVRSFAPRFADVVWRTNLSSGAMRGNQTFFAASFTDVAERQRLGAVVVGLASGLDTCAALLLTNLGARTICVLCTFRAALPIVADQGGIAIFAVRAFYTATDIRIADTCFAVIVLHTRDAFPVGAAYRVRAMLILHARIADALIANGCARRTIDPVTTRAAEVRFQVAYARFAIVGR